MAPVAREIKFHEILRELIRQAGTTMTSKKLATAIGLSDSTVSHYLTGRNRPSFEAVVDIAQYFNVTLDYLVFGERLEAPAAVVNADSVQAQVQRALAESNSLMGRERDLVVRVTRVLHEEVARVARDLLAVPENVGPAGFLTDPEALAIESCARRTRVLIQGAPADIVEDPSSGRISRGVYFHTLAGNLAGGRSYQYLFYGKRNRYARYAAAYTDFLREDDVPAERVREGLELRAVDSELAGSIVIYELDDAALQRREPIVRERYLGNGIYDNVLAYIAVRYKDALGGVVLHDEYLASVLRMFERDWRLGSPL